jgi:hypothetical protein
MRHAGRIAAFAFLLFASELPAFEMDLGAGITIDVAPFGVESVEPLVILARWVGLRDGLQVGAMLAGSFGAGTSDAALALCARLWPISNILALYGGAGILAAPGQDPSVMPYALGGLRLEAGHVAFIAPGLAVRFKPTGSDTEVWFGVLYRL